MGLIYLDCETAAKKPKPDQPDEYEDMNPKVTTIVTIQHRPLDSSIPIPLSIHTEWNHPQGERGIVTDFVTKTQYWNRKWQAVGVGWNLDYDESLLWQKSKKYGLVPWNADYFDYAKPRIDLRTLGLVFNADAKPKPDGPDWGVPPMFRGTKLSDFSRKVGSGAHIGELYRRKAYDSILRYIEQEWVAFDELWRLLSTEMPPLWRNTLKPRLAAA